ncbi:MAG TPA: hypothetical protein DCE41_19715 [Cytophagales bacterium]|nr:hypothetical protein [Cytophagales bacterium]
MMETEFLMFKSTLSFAEKNDPNYWTLIRVLIRFSRKGKILGQMWLFRAPMVAMLYPCVGV